MHSTISKRHFKRLVKKKEEQLLAFKEVDINERDILSHASVEDDVKDFSSEILPSCSMIEGTDGEVLRTILLELRALQSDVTDLSNRIAVIETNQQGMQIRQERLISQCAENAVILKHGLKCNQVHQVEQFPIQSEEDLIKFNDEITAVEVVAASIKRILDQQPFARKISWIFGQQILINYNFDGTQGKKPLRDLKNVTEALFDALRTDDKHDKVIETEIRQAFRAAKNRYHKARSVRKSVQMRTPLPIE
ncbi:uncharacterized protein LOC119689925 [Teleopsis dalmanni]|uniref:uncharacterized protein LOC119689925 n=1 Tax=Teleopsis dalmanni TaxID=139649 RepID=UPI0018CCF882|nr:uncharacterized protein LOC119689925 [Teleopsis dalmanni]